MSLKSSSDAEGYLPIMLQDRDRPRIADGLDRSFTVVKRGMGMGTAMDADVPISKLSKLTEKEIEENKENV